MISLRDNAARHSASPRIRPDLSDCDVVYIAPDVPTDDRRQSDLLGRIRLLSLVLADTCGRMP